MGWSLGRLVVLLAALLMTARGAAQVPAAAGAELQAMASHAGVIFSGQVVEISREDAAGFVDVRFRIDEAVRGCPKTGWYVLREWAGLWTGQPERYRVGQRRLMLLTARGPGGMSSPVGGMDGAIPLVAAGVAPVADAAGVAPADMGPVVDLAVDLRWIAARTVPGTVPNASARVVARGGPVQPASARVVAPVMLGSVLTLLQGGAAREALGVGDARY